MNKVLLSVLSTTLLFSPAFAQKAMPANPAAPTSCAQFLKVKVNLNKATEAQLVCLKGVKSATAKDIIANRPFKDAADFSKKIEDIGKKIYEMNKASISF